MLEWITGASRSQNNDDYSDVDEIPETPGHIFAMRAFKSAIWGTPAPADMTTEKSTRFKRLSGLSLSRKQAIVEENEELPKKPMVRSRHSDPLASPTKGILMTPGSVSTKRKSVSFGGLAPDPESSEDDEQDEESDIEPTLYPPPAQSPIKKPSEPIEEDLRRSLFQARGGNSQISDVKEEQETVDGSESETDARSLTTVSVVTEEDLGPSTTVSVLSTDDSTIDLKNPRSQSGKHWKREYQRDHDKSKAEMKRLIRYSQMAKSYAEKRDHDAIRMAEKLQEAEEKAKSMEDRIQDLAAQLMDAQTQGNKQEEILTEVASQTAEAFRQKQKAEHYRTALRTNEKLHRQNNNDNTKANPESADGLELQVSNLQQAAKKAEGRASELEKENRTLKSTMARVKDEMKQYEVRHAEERERRKRKEERNNAEKKRLKDLVDELKRENESILAELESLRLTTRDSELSGSMRRKSKPHQEITPPTSDEDQRHSSKEDLDHETAQSRSPAKSPGLQSPGTRIGNYDSWSNRSSPRRSSRDLGRAEVRQNPSPLFTTSHSLMDSFSQPPKFELSPPHSPPHSPYEYSHLLASSRANSLVSRSFLPPERAAAARKRLEEKAAERRALASVGKINRSPCV
jgi:hypothetical protein